MIEVFYKDLTESKRDPECIMYDSFREAYIDLIDHLTNHWSVGYTSFPARVTIDYMAGPFKKMVSFQELEDNLEEDI